MRLTILAKAQGGDGDFVCADEEGFRHTVDLFVDNGLEGFPDDGDRMSLIGKTVEVSYLMPFIEIASEPRLID